MPIRDLPEPPASLHVLGPGLLLAALGVGLGETYLWPRLVILFGPEIRWLFFIGVTLQGIVMLEMARYATATGESIFFGAARLWRPIMWLFFIIAVMVYIWPGHVALGAQAFESLTGISWYVFGVAGLILIGVIISFSTIVYNVVEAILSTLIGILVIGSSIIAALVGNLGFVWATITGLFTFGYFPQEAISGPQAAELFPLIVGAIAFAGP
ncbi:MAG: Nramp family divalent metal transporter, partial [Rubrobacteraceae bacterium]